MDEVLGSPASGREGGTRRAVDGHVAFGGLADASQKRNLLLPALWALQSDIGWISPGGLDYVCARLRVPPAEAYGVASFYALLATEPRPTRVAHVCDDVACQAAGVEAVAADLERRLGAEGAADTGVMWLRSPCLGRCDQAPAAYVQRAATADLELGGVDATGIAAALTGPTPKGTAEPYAAGGTLLRRLGTVDPRSLDAYRTAGGYSALARAFDVGPDQVIDRLEASGLRGRGGAAFPIGVKWRAVAANPTVPKYVIANADESEPGTFKDRALMEGDPFALVESLTIAGITVGAEQGYIYLRGEYLKAAARLEHALEAARTAGLLGDDVAGSGRSFEIELRRGAGAYVCGEETALFNSIVGFRGEPRQKPPFPVEHGLFGRPTVINNVETLANVPAIVLDGGERFAAVGTAESTGTKLFSVSGHVARPGVYEVAMGTTLENLIAQAGGVTGTLAAVLVGGAAGSFIGPELIDLPLSFEATRHAGLTLGSGAIVVFDTTTDFARIVLRIAAFFRDESCGQCVPCRVGTVRMEEALARISSGSDRSAEVDLIGDLATVMADASICGLGQLAPVAIRSALELGLI